jgi:DNA-binding transcriptional LysR family regulator
MGVKVLRVDAEDRFPKALRGVSDSSLAWMEQKSYTWVRSLELLLTDTRLDLFNDRIDVAVRLGALQDNKLVTTKLCDIPYIVCASPEYLRRFGTPENQLTSMGTMPCVYRCQSTTSGAFAMPRAMSKQSCPLSEGLLSY